jgi:hypothetical protein
VDVQREDNWQRRFGLLMTAVALLSLYTTRPSLCRAQSVSRTLPNLNYSNLPLYQRELQQSRDPCAQAILRQVTDGPADLARELALAKREGISFDVKSLNQPAPGLWSHVSPQAREFVRVPIAWCNCLGIIRIDRLLTYRICTLSCVM